MSIFLNLLITIGILTSTICSFHSEKKKWLRSLIIIGAVVAIGALLIQVFIKHSDDKAHRKELSDEVSRYETLKTQHDSLQTINEKLNEKFDNLTNEHQKLKDTIMHPVLEYYKDGFKITEDDSTGKFKSSFVYRSKRSTVAIRDVNIELEFDKPIIKAFVIVRKIEGGEMTQSQIEVKNSYGATKLTVSAEELKEGFNLIIEVFSDEPLEIVSNEFSP